MTLESIMFRVWGKLTTRQKLTVALLGLYVASLVIEVPYGTVADLIPKHGVAAAVGPVIIEAVFVALMAVFIIYGLRLKPWAYVGAMVVGILHAMLSAFIYFMPGGPPLAVAVYLTGLPALLAVTAAAVVIEMRGRTRV